MLIGERIKTLREREGLTQENFAGEIGVEGSYISLLERGKREPSEQLLLNICRTFDVRREWLKNGKGPIRERSPKYSHKGSLVMEEIDKRLHEYKQPLPLSVVAEILGIDFNNPTKNSKFMKEEFSDLIVMISRIVKEGDKSKIDTLKNFIRLLHNEKSRKR